MTTAAKWLLVGRCRSAEHPLWSSFVWRNELADTFVEELAVPWLAGRAIGTPLLNVWLRSLGARIGRGAWIETYWLPEPDLIEIGQDATVGRGVVVQTHLFHDRIMRLDRVRIGEGATLGAHVIALPGSTGGRGRHDWTAVAGDAGRVRPGAQPLDGQPHLGLAGRPGRAARRRPGRGGRLPDRRGSGGNLPALRTRRPTATTPLRLPRGGAVAAREVR